MRKANPAIKKDKIYIWAFPGMGKSSLNTPKNVLDADCKMFEYHLPPAQKSWLHRPQILPGVSPQADYPQNYLDYIQNADAEIVLLNCHLSVLSGFDQEKLLLVYPSVELKPVYLDRYRQRKDHPSFVQHMEESFEDVVAAVKRAPFRKYEVKESYLYLQHLLEEGGILMRQFITKKELTELLDESIRLGVYTPNPGHMQNTPSELAQLMFDGEVDLDLDQLRKTLSAKRADMEKDRMYQQRRGGLTHEELRDKIMQGLTNGALRITHGEISPYSYGYQVNYPNSKTKYTNRWECYCPLSQVAETITRHIEQGRQDKQVFSSNTLQPLDIHALLRSIEEKEQCRLEAFTPESQTNLVRRSRYDGHVATLEDVHSGQALDGIILGHFHGDYSSITTSKQNELLETLVALKGFCLDCLPRLSTDYRDLVISHLQKQNIDISTPDKLQAWINANPDKCGLAVNRARKPSLDSTMQSAQSRSGDNLSAGPRSDRCPDRS